LSYYKLLAQMQYTANEIKKITAQIKNKFSIICSKMSGKIGISKFVNLRNCRFDGVNVINSRIGTAY